MQLLAAVEGDGGTPLAEMLLSGLPKLRRGMTAVVVTASRERRWVRALTVLRARGVAAAVIALDAASYEVEGRPPARWRRCRQSGEAGAASAAFRPGRVRHQVPRGPRRRQPRGGARMSVRAQPEVLRQRRDQLSYDDEPGPVARSHRSPAPRRRLGQPAAGSHPVRSDGLDHRQRPLDPWAR
jgi:hypothetical protein